MLEVLNLTKVYKTKGGVDVAALDGVSLRFPERGMVFLLGKSGSGKSTLLNVCGGLDAPTSGEIIVKGRSSRDFTQSDFDSYRNTFIGFIFQEYNILNEFSVEDNIALALELQGKPKDKEAVTALLEEVDLTGYAKRKPNTLSGGQKQRIAIARALIKSPEIIMADEPTGALDSNTGKQVFDTLKKLSRDKLVIVVSHDREFAEQYGDRVIELKDGKILSDVTKTVEEQTSLSENVSAIGQTLTVKRGSDLTDADFEKIRTFLKSTDRDVVITGGEQEVRAFREVTRITDGGGQEVFRDTDEAVIDKKAYTEEDSRFIRSKLPLRHAARIGLAGLKTKPFRLAFTAFLCTVAFILFGLLSTLVFYDSESTFRETLSDSHYKLLRIEKQYRTHEKQYEYGELVREYESLGQRAMLSAADVAALSNALGAKAFGAMEADISVSVQQTSSYYLSDISWAAAPTDASMLGTLLGAMPAAKDEIVISSYLADAFINNKVQLSDGDYLNVNARQDLLGKKLSLDLTNASSDDDVYKIVGIFESADVPAKYEALKDTASSDRDLRYELEQWLTDGTSSLVLVHEDTLEAMADRFYWYSGNGSFEGRDIFVADYRGEYPSDQWSNGYYASVEGATGLIYFTEGKNTLAAGEALISMPSFTGYFGFLVDSLRPAQVEYNRWAYEEAIRMAQGEIPNAAEIADSWYNSWNMSWDGEHYYFNAVAPGDPLYEAYSTVFAVMTEDELLRYYGDSNHTLLHNALVDEGVESEAAWTLISDWQQYLEGSRGEGEDAVTPPVEGQVGYAVYTELATYYENYKLGLGALWYSPIKSEVIAAIEEVVGIRYNEYDLLAMWEGTYGTDDTPDYTASNTHLAAAYADFSTAYDVYSAYLAEMEEFEELDRLWGVAVDLSNNWIYDDTMGENGDWREPTAAERTAMIAELLAGYRAMSADPYIAKFKLFDRDMAQAYGTEKSYTVVGVFDNSDYGTRFYLPAADADAFYADQVSRLPYHWTSETKYQKGENDIFSTMFVAYDHSEGATDFFTTMYVDREVYGDSDTNFAIVSDLAATFTMVDSMVSQFKQIFLYVGLVMAAFSALLLSNFISVSISHKRREIGILRAVGARSLDVFKIFFSESFFITAICIVLSVTGSAIICSVVNGIVNELLGASLFVFGILSVAVLLGVALLTVVVATFLPVYNAAKRKPVDSIRSL